MAYKKKKGIKSKIKKLNKQVRKTKRMVKVKKHYRKATPHLVSNYNKVEKSVGASRIVERVLNITGVVPEPYKSALTTGVGFQKGGLTGGIGALVFSSNIPEMVLGGNLFNMDNNNGLNGDSL